MENKAISNTGPIIHLTEINLINSLNIFSGVSIPKEVAQELSKYHISLPKKIKIEELNQSSKDTVKVLTNQHDLDFGEACAIALALQEKAICFLTDDLDARKVSKKYGLDVHGTVGIILRAFREKIIDKKTAIKKINEIHSISSLFITKDLINSILKAIEDFKNSS